MVAAGPGRAAACAPARLPLLVSLLVCVVLAGCAAENRGAVQAAGSDGQLTVVATMTVLAEFAEEVGGGHVTVTSLVPLGGDPHGYEPVPGDAAAVSEADVVIDNGMGLLPWFDALKTNVEGHLLVLAEEIEGDARTDREGRPDPHFWMSPAYAADYVTAIEEALATADPQGADHYRANAEAYRDHLTAVDQEVGEILGVVPAGTRHLVTYEDAYGYFADHYDFEVAGSVLGATTEEEPSAQHLRELVDLIRDRDVAAVFPQATENPAVMEWLARDAGVELGEELFVDSLGDPGSGTETYAGLLRSNAKAIAEALGGGGDE